jgi:RNA polymerase sigma factor (sigma-70 family)
MEQVSEIAGLAPVARQKRPNQAFAGFFEAEYRRLARAMYLLTRDRQEADDLAQEALVRVYERWDSVGAMKSPTGYLYRTALNLHRSRLRQIAVRTRRALALEPFSSGDPLSSVEDRDELGRLLAALPRAQREALVLFEWLELDAEEAARLMGISPAAARMRLSRARTFLRKHLGGSDG